MTHSFGTSSINLRPIANYFAVGMLHLSVLCLKAQGRAPVLSERLLIFAGQDVEGPSAGLSEASGRAWR